MTTTPNDDLDRTMVGASDQQDVSQLSQINWLVRAFLGSVGAGLAILLIVAACLSPSPQGFGTHQQLGLPECSIKMMFEMPCPSCGMTTSWSHMMRGQFISSCKANPGGALLAITSIFLCPWLLITAAKGAWFVGVPPDWFTILVAVTLLVVTLTHWCFQLML